MNAKLFVAAVVAVAAPAFAQSFHFDPWSGACVNAAGERGLNTGVRGPCGDFGGQDLAGASFEGLDLRGARFDGAKLSGASFKGSTLTQASFTGADLSEAVLTGAKVEGAVFTKARMVRVHLEHALLAGAQLDGADLRNACLFRAEFTGADLRTATFSKNKLVLGGARWFGARVLADTLPFTTEELASRSLAVEGQLAAR